MHQIPVSIMWSSTAFQVESSPDDALNGGMMMDAGAIIV